MAEAFGDRISHRNREQPEAHQTLGRARANFEEPTTIEFTTSEGDEVQLMAPGDPYYEFFRRHAAGPVPLFEVDDVHAAGRQLEEAGVEIVGPPGRDSRWEWIHFLAPDGNLYELASRLSTGDPP